MNRRLLDYADFADE